MERSKTGFIPLPYANTKQIRINLDLPRYIDKDKIGVHISNTEKMCKMGGIRHLIITTESGKISSSEVNIVGSTEQGEAFAGKTKNINIPTSTSQSYDEDQRSVLTRCAEWKIVVIKINIDEVANRINQDRKYAGGLRSTEGWAKYLNRDIKEKITKEGAHHLVLGLSKSQLLFTVFIDLPFNGRSYTDLFMFFRSVLIGNFAANVFSHGYAMVLGKNSRYSLFFGPELDRAGILYIMSKTKTLVRTI